MAESPDIALTLRLLERLVAFDTTSRNSNLELIAWVEAYLAERGIESRRVDGDHPGKASLLARVGPEIEGGIVLSGHTDVVPVDGQAWSSDPWTLTERGGKYFARGAADMKTFLALALAHIDAANAAPLRRPFMLAFSHDEEIGCLAAPALAQQMHTALPRPAAVIVGEPTDMKVVSGHKGIRTFLVEVEGREGHSSKVNDGVSAIMEALKLMQFIADEAKTQRQHADTEEGFDPPGATMTIGLVEGGTASNILARRCSFVWDLRCPPSVDPDAIEQRFFAAAARVDTDIRARAPGGGVRVTRRSTTPAFAPDRDSEAEQFVRALTGDNGFCAAAYAAEAGVFQSAGFAAVICGPGSIDQAHQPDEWVSREQIELGVQFMQRLVARLSE